MKLIFLAVLVIVAAALQWWSGKRGLEKLAVTLHPSSALVEPGDEFELVLTFMNEGRLFIPFLRYRVHVPEGVDVHLDSSHIHTEVGYLNKTARAQYITGTTWLGPRQRLEKRIPISIAKRGYYTFHELTVYGGDFLGLKEQPQSFRRFREVVVYPKAASRQEVSQVFGGFLGEMSVRRFIQEDPVLTLGYREYSGREPMKTISWTQSARRGELMVKKFDYTLEPSVSVILNIESSAEDRETRLEQCFSLVRSVCAELEEKGVKYDFRMNAVARGSVRASDYFSEGLGRGHYYGILEYLGRATYMTRCACPVMLEKAATSAVSGRGVVLITPGGDPETEACARRFAEQGGGTLLILTAKGEEKC